MLRIVSTAIRDFVVRTNAPTIAYSVISKELPLAKCFQQRCFGAFSSNLSKPNIVNGILQKNVFGSTEVNNIVPKTLSPNVTSVRTLIKYSRGKGKRKTVKAVVKRFYRLNWGIWIRTIAGRHTKLWKKSGKQRQRFKQHVFCNSTQSTLLDKMVTKYWKRPRYYVNDPYNPYHVREEFPITRRTPKLY